MNELAMLITAALENGFNQYLRLDPNAVERLARLQGKVIAIQLRDTDICLYLIPGHDGVQVLSHFEGAADATIIGSAVGFFDLARGNEDVMFKGEVEIRGDLELGQRVKRILDKLDIDWEEQLSHYTGDVLAHKLGDLAREGRQWGANLLDSLAHNVSEYLQQESRDLPMEHEVTPFFAEVDRFRDDVERLQARVKRLQQILSDEKESQ